MATSYKIRLKRFNGTDYDTLNLISDNIIMSSGNNLQTDYNNLDGAIDDIVYVGDDAPTDPNTKIWLDTDASGASAVNSVNGKVGTVVLDADDVGAMSKWVLLWTNASPTSSFAEQTISLDLSEYDAVYVVNRLTTTSVNYGLPCIALKTDGSSYTAMKQVTNSGANVQVNTRTATVINSGVTFSDGNKINQGSASATDNTVLIPYKIFGIRGLA